MFREKAEKVILQLDAKEAARTRSQLRIECRRNPLARNTYGGGIGIEYAKVRGVRGFQRVRGHLGKHPLHDRPHRHGFIEAKLRDFFANLVRSPSGSEGLVGSFSRGLFN